MNSAQLINQNSGNVEIYTPPNIIEAARETLGGFDLDPASSAKANETVKASRYFTEGGLDQRWAGRVWMNHPFGRRLTRPKKPGPDATADDLKKFEARWVEWVARCVPNLLDPQTAERAPGNEDWINKLENSYNSGHLTGACCITFASTSEAWFRPLLMRTQCFLSPRTNYLLPNGEAYRGVTKGSVVTYFGSDMNRFARAFKHLGVVKILHVSP